MQNTLLPSTGLAEFYRFALLLTGSSEAAERVIAATLDEADKRIGDLRDEAHRVAWLAARIRQRCLEKKGPSLPVSPSAGGELGQSPAEADELVRHFCALPEPERSALALFYLDPFTLDQIAHLLGMKLDQLAETLGRARCLLERAARLPRTQTA